MGQTFGLNGALQIVPPAIFFLKAVGHRVFYKCSSAQAFRGFAAELHIGWS
jgi:hypothetical protein